MSQPDNTSTELIRAISELWKLAGIIFLMFAMWRFSPQIRKVIDKTKFWKFKRGDTEISIEQEPTPQQETPTTSPQVSESQQESDSGIVDTKDSSDWFMEMYNAFHDNRYDDAENAFKKAQSSEEDIAERVKTEIIYHALNYRNNRDSTALEKLEKYTEDKQYSGFAYTWIASNHAYSRNYTAAIKTYQKAIDAEANDINKAQSAVSLSDCMVSLGEKNEALEYLTNFLPKVGDDKAIASIYVGIADIAEHLDDKVLRAISLQMALQYKPDDPSIRFDAAYAQYKADLTQLSTINYHTLLRFKPNHRMAFNNLGVSCNKLQMQLKSISYFKKSIEKDETLAMANTAYQYIDSGFEEEVTKILNKAKIIENSHSKVVQTISDLAERKEKEDTIWNKTIDIGTRQQEFFWRYANAYFKPHKIESTFSGSWISSGNQTFIVEHEGVKITGKWEEKNSGEHFSGTMRNLAATILYKRKSPGLGISDGYWGNAVNGFAWFSPQEHKWHIAITSGDDLIFFDLSKKDNDDVSILKSTDVEA